MGKKINHDFGENNWGDEKNWGNEGNWEKGKIIKMAPRSEGLDTLVKKYNDELVSNIGSKGILQFTKITSDILTKELGSDCTITWKQVGENYRLDITKKGIKQKTQGQILVAVQSDGTFNVRLNPYKNYQDYYFLNGLDTKGLMDEMATIKWFLIDETVPPGSKFKKEVYYSKAA